MFYPLKAPSTKFLQVSDCMMICWMGMRIEFVTVEETGRMMDNRLRLVIQMVTLMETSKVLKKETSFRMVLSTGSVREVY